MGMDSYGGVMQGEGQKPPTLGTSRDNGLNRVPLDGPPTYIHEDHVSLWSGSVTGVVDWGAYQDHGLGRGQIMFADRNLKHGGGGERRRIYIIGEGRGIDLM